MFDKDHLSAYEFIARATQHTLYRVKRVCQIHSLVSAVFRFASSSIRPAEKKVDMK